MPKYYSFQKGKFGGASGTIFPFSKTLSGNKPNEIDWRTYVPAGFLRCDGSVLDADDYRSLADVIGVGDNCIYKQSGTILNNPNPETNYGGQIQLPDLGSKCITAGSSSSGTILDDSVVDPTTGVSTDKTGIGVELSLNQGTAITVNYSGNFSVPTTDVPVSGNYVMDFAGISANANISAEQMLPHGHYSDAARLAIDENSIPSREVCIRGKKLPNEDLNTTNGGEGVNILDDRTISSSGSLAQTEHLHSVARTNPTHNTSASIPTFEVDGSAITTTVNISSDDITVFDEIPQRFIIVEYLIKI